MVVLTRKRNIPKSRTNSRRGRMSQLIGGQRPIVMKVVKPLSIPKTGLRSTLKVSPSTTSVPRTSSITKRTQEHVLLKPHNRSVVHNKKGKTGQSVGNLVSQFSHGAVPFKSKTTGLESTVLENLLALKQNTSPQEPRLQASQPIKVVFTGVQNTSATEAVPKTRNFTDSPLTIEEIQAGEKAMVYGFDDVHFKKDTYQNDAVNIYKTPQNFNNMTVTQMIKPGNMVNKNVGSKSGFTTDTLRTLFGELPDATPKNTLETNIAMEKEARLMMLGAQNATRKIIRLKSQQELDRKFLAEQQKEREFYNILTQSKEFQFNQKHLEQTRSLIDEKLVEEYNAELELNKANTPVDIKKAQDNLESIKEELELLEYENKLVYDMNQQLVIESEQAARAELEREEKLNREYATAAQKAKVIKKKRSIKKEVRKNENE